MGLFVPKLTVTEAPFASADVLIGMDVIGLDDFSITHKSEKTVMTFRIPSMVEHDYVQEVGNHNLKMQQRDLRANFGQ